MAKRAPSLFDDDPPPPAAAPPQQKPREARTFRGVAGKLPDRDLTADEELLDRCKLTLLRVRNSALTKPAPDWLLTECGQRTKEIDERLGIVYDIPDFSAKRKKTDEDHTDE